MIMKALSKFRFPIQAFTVFSAALAVGTLIFFGLHANHFSVSKIQITPTSGQESEYFEHFKNEVEADLSPLKKELIWKVNIRDIIAKIKKKPWVQEAQARRVFPNKLEINLALQEIEFILVAERGDKYPISKDGKLLPKISDRFLPDVPLLRGRKFFDDMDLREEVLLLSSLLPPTGTLSRAGLSEIYFEAKNGFEILLNDVGVRIILGQENFELKLKRVAKVLEYLDAKSIEGRVIDARFEKKILVRLRKGS